MQNEGRKIMHLPELKVSCTCVRVPVVRSHSISVTLHFDRPVSVAEAREIIAAAPGCKLVDDLASKVYPMPLDLSLIHILGLHAVHGLLPVRGGGHDGISQGLQFVF